PSPEHPLVAEVVAVQKIDRRERAAALLLQFEHFDGVGATGDDEATLRFEQRARIAAAFGEAGAVDLEQGVAVVRPRAGIRRKAADVVVYVFGRAAPRDLGVFAVDL